MMNYQELRLGQKIISIYCLLLLIFGTLANFFSFYICFTPKLRKYPTFVFLGFIVIFDTVALWVLNVNLFTRNFINKGYINEIGLPLVRLVLFAEFASIEISSFLLIATAVERYLSIKIMAWRKLYFSSKRAFILSAVIVVSLLALNIPVFLIKFDVDPYLNSTYNSAFNQFAVTPFVRTYIEISAILYSVVPIIILFIMNTLLLQATMGCFRKSTIDRSDKNKAKRRSMTISVIAVTAIFVILAMPNTIITGMLSGDSLRSEYGNFLIAIGFAFQFTNHASTFVTLYFTNTIFKDKTKMIFEKSINNIKT